MGKIILNNGQQLKEEGANKGGFERLTVIIQWVGVIFAVIGVGSLFGGLFHEALLILVIVLWIAFIIIGYNTEQTKELLGQINVLLNGVDEDFADKECKYWTLFNEINKRLHESGLSYAWKSYPDSPDYNSYLGILEKQIGQKTARVSIGLPSDNFFKTCAVIQLTPYDE